MSSPVFGPSKQEENDQAMITTDELLPVQIAAMSENSPAPLFYEGEATEFQSRWDKIQAGFVDEPRKAVEQADELVAAAMNRLTVIFADERTKMEQVWAKGKDVSTEDLRVSLMRYRSFFNRLLVV